MSAKQLIIIITILTALSLFVWLLLFFLPQINAPENTLIITQQSANLEKKLQNLLTGGQNLRLQEFQKTLKSFAPLPLPSRVGGKDNPFLQLTEPSDQFSRPALPGATTLPNKNISNKK